MTREQVIALARRTTVTDVETAGRAFGISRNPAYEMAAAGTFPVPVRRYGRRLRVVTADIVNALGINLDDAAPNDVAAVN